MPARALLSLPIMWSVAIGMDGPFDSGRLRTLLAHWPRALAACAVGIFGGQALAISGLALAPALNFSILSQSVPIFTTLLAACAGVEAVTAAKAGGVGLAVLGAVAMIWASTVPRGAPSSPSSPSPSPSGPDGGDRAYEPAAGHVWPPGPGPQPHPPSLPGGRAGLDTLVWLLAGPPVAQPAPAPASSLLPPLGAAAIGGGGAEVPAGGSAAYPYLLAGNLCFLGAACCAAIMLTTTRVRERERDREGAWAWRREERGRVV